MPVLVFIAKRSLAERTRALGAEEKLQGKQNSLSIGVSEQIEECIHAFTESSSVQSMRAGNC